MSPAAEVAEKRAGPPLLEEDDSMANGQEADSAPHLDVLLHEYDTLRVEILARTSSRFQLLGLAAVAATLVTAKWGSGNLAKGDIIKLVAGIVGGTAVVAAVIWLVFGLYINRCAARIKQIEEEINNKLGEPVLIWQSRLVPLSKLVSLRPSRSKSKAEVEWCKALQEAREAAGILWF
jgi:hypothetical protein